MGVLSKALDDAGLSPKPEFVDGYKPEKCWFRNGYITSDLIGLVREAIIGSDEMSEEDIILICDYMCFHMRPGTITVEEVVAKLDYKLETTINQWQNNRGVAMSHEDEEFVMRMLGWRDFCLMQGIISQGKNVQVKIKERPGHTCHGYYIVEV